MQKEFDAKVYSDPEQMAEQYLAQYFGNEKIEYPINPFKMLKDEGILFLLSEFVKLEGVYIPRASEDDIPVVGINTNKPITRQRFTAAHELCHHFRDADKQISCPISGKKTGIEIFADKFSAALLMPLNELRTQVNKRKNNCNCVSFDDVLEIADYFGVSFESCLFRIAYKIHAISGDTEPKELKKRIKQYGPDKVRKRKHLTYANLYAGLIDCYYEQLTFEPSEYARILFQNNYIYNDSRMEGLNLTIEEASEIVTDLRLKMQNSDFCTEENEVFLSIAGHYDMYQDIFTIPVKDSLDVYETFTLHKKLFSHYPYPELGGSSRQNNTIVIGAKFETVDYHDIFAEMAKVDVQVKEYYAKRHDMTMSEYTKHVVRIHHRLTQIHPFQDGNGRTLRAFMNIQFVRAGMVPVYIKVEEKAEYVEALSRADEYDDYEPLYEIIFRLILRSYVDLNKGR